MAEQVTRPNQVEQVAVVSLERPREINMPAKWERVADEVRRRIRTGTYTTDLPSYRLLAAEFDCSVGTIRSAFLVLRAEGWIEGESGVATRVRADHPK